MIIKYKTRDEKGNDFIKDVKIKEFPVVNAEFDCPICKRHCTEGHLTSKCVSSKFTDWEYFDKYICCNCARLFSLYFYSYIVENGEIKLFNLREIKENIFRNHELPFMFIITKTQKKHLWYRAVMNESDDNFAIQLETETIFTNRDRMKYLFDFVELLMSLGQSKMQMSEGNLSYDIMKRPFGSKAFEILNYELAASREIQIPLHCGQKIENMEENEICNSISKLIM